nr:multiple inositol polyphosphate phosphatase 1 isoform X1 [Leptinotarsa decemlineata]XP_023025069.1 multiple inositol polyphosphate phosphatase 1 isoform X2 [Leptinotarsa decemlineata]
MGISSIVLVFIFLASTSGQNNNYPFDSNRQEDCCEDYCYVTDEEPYTFFGTKTVYDSLPNRHSSSQHIVRECSPVQFWSIIRHGTKYPSIEKLRKLRNLNKLHEEMLRNYLERKSYPDRGRLCTNDFDLIRNWRFNDSITDNYANGLTSQGAEDMKLLARRYKTQYSEVLQNYDERSYYFQYSTDDRSHDSFQAYIEGLFGSDYYRVHANTVNSDNLTKPEENCPNWSEGENNNPAMKSEVERFKENPEYLKMVRDVFQRLGFRYLLNASNIEDIYDACAYEKAWNIQRRSPWCIAFNKDQLKLLEYAEDLEYYYKAGYGNQNSKRIGCAPVKDLYERFEKTVNGNPDGNKGTFLFSRATTFQTVLVSLGIAKDFTPPTADNYYQQSRRNWRVSMLDPFAANLAAVLYECRGNEKYKVMFFLNEKPVEFPECSVGLCSWTTVQQKYQEIVRNCNIDYFCKGNTAPKTYVSYITLVLTTFLFYVI